MRLPSVFVVSCSLLAALNLAHASKEQTSVYVASSPDGKEQSVAIQEPASAPTLKEFRTILEKNGFKSSGPVEIWARTPGVTAHIYEQNGGNNGFTLTFATSDLDETGASYTPKSQFNTTFNYSAGIRGAAARQVYQWISKVNGSRFLSRNSVEGIGLIKSGRLADIKDPTDRSLANFLVRCYFDTENPVEIAPNFSTKCVFRGVAK